MKKLSIPFLKLITFIVINLFSFTAFAGSGIFESYVIVDVNGGGNTYYDLFATTVNADFQGTSFGSFTCGNSLIIRGGQNKTYKNGTDDILNGYIHYRVYKNGTDPNLATWVSIQLGGVADLGGGDQSWSSTSGTSNILRNPLTGNALPDGTYTIEVYTTADFTYSGSVSTQTHYQNVGGVNYKATFTISNPIAITLPPASSSICSGSSVTLSATATGADTYYWQEEITAGSWSNVSGGFGSMNIAGATVTTTISNITTTRKFRCQFTNCGGVNQSNSDVATITPQQPTISVQPISQIDCESNAVNFAITASTGTKFEWYRKRPTDGSFILLSTTTIAGGSTLNLTNIGNAQNPHLSEYKCVVTDASTCTNTSNTVALSVNSIGNISDSPVICAGGNTSFAVSLVGTPTAIKWQKGESENAVTNYSDLTDSSPNIVGSTTTNLSLANVPFSDNDKYFRVRVTFTKTSGTCIRTQSVSPASTGKLTVNALPSVPTVTNAARCSLGSVEVPLSASGAGSGQNYKWYVDNNTATEFFQKDLATYNPTLSATTDYYVSIYATSSPFCESARVKVTGTVNPLPTITLGSVADICNSVTTFALPFSATTNSPDQYSISTGSPALISAINNAALGSSPISVTIPVNASANTYQFSISVTNSTTTCSSTPQNFTVKINDTPTAPVVVSPINYCQNVSTIALSATTSGSNSLLWYGTNSTGGTSSASAPIPSSSALGTTTYYVSQKTPENCESTRASISVVINENPAVPTTNTTINYCKDATSTALSATASGSNSLIWYDANDNILASAPTPSTSTVGTQTFKVSQKTPSPANCESPKVIITINVFENPVAPTVTTPVGYCQNTTASALSATATGSNTLLWYGTNASGGTSSMSIPTPSTNIAGTTSYYVSQKDANNCESPRAKIDVEITPAVSGNITGVNALCLTGVLNNATTLTANPSGGNGTFGYQWQNLAGNIALATNQTYEVTNAFQTSNSDTYKVIITSGYCTTTANLVVTKQGWNDVPSVTGNTPDICASGSKTLSIVSPNASGIYKWFVDATTLVHTATGTSFPTPILTSSTTYYVAREQQVTASLTCQTVRTPVTINVITAPPTPTIINSAEGTFFCNSASDFTLSVSCSSGSGQYRLNSSTWITGNSVTVSPMTYPANTTFTYDFKCVLSSTCESEIASTSITIAPTPTAPTISGNTTICTGGSTTLTASGCIGDVVWNTEDFGSTLNVTTAGNYSAICLNDDCESVSSNVLTVVISAIPAKPTIISGDADNTICAGGSIKLSVSSCAGNVIWSNGTTATFINVSSSGTYSATCTENSCVSPASDIQTITVNTTPTAPTITSDDADNIVCAGTNVILTASNCTGSVVWSNGITATSITVSSSGTYNAQCSVNACLSVASSLQTIVVNAIPDAPTITSDDADNIVCSGTNVILTASNCAGSVVWSNGTTATSITVSSSGTYTARCSVNNCLSSPSGIQTVVVNAFPVFSTQPTSQTNCKGANASFTGTVNLSSTLQWEYRKTSSEIFTAVGSSTTGTTLLFSASSIGSANYPHGSEFRLKATSNGCVTYSNIVTLNVNSVTGDIPDQTKCNGGSTSFDLSSLAIVGTISSYQWEVSTSAASGFGNVTGSQFSGITTNILTINPISDDGVPKYYRCKMVFTNTASGNCTITSNSGKLTVTTIAPPTVSGATAICSGTSTTLTASGCAGTVTWSTGVSGSTASVSSAGTYSATCTQSGCTSLASNVHTLTVNAIPSAPTISSDDADNVVCQGTNIVLTASDCAGTIIWSNATTGSTITISASGTYNATCTVNSCVSAASVLQTIVVNAIPTAPSISGSTSICSGNSTTLTASGCAGTVTWSTGATGSTLSVSAAGTYNATCTTNGCVSMASSTQTITINSIPDAPVISGNTSFCVGTNTTLTASGCIGTITWNTLATGSSLNVTSAGTYNATCTVNSCTSSASSNYVITENPLPSITLSVVNSICNASTTFDLAYTATANNPNKYSLTSTMPDFVAVSETDLPSSPISVLIPSGKTGIHTFTLNIKNTSTSCANSQTFSVTILPILAGGSIEVSPSSINCAGYTPASISSESLASGGKSAYTYQWQSSTDGTNFTDISGANQSGFTPTTSITQTTYYRRKVTDACNAEAFSSNNHQVTIVPDPQITLTDASDKVICSGHSFTLDATVLGGSGTCTPTWQSSNSASTGFATEQSGGLLFTKSLTNTSATPLVKYFRVVYSCAGTGSGSCNQSTSEVAKVTVNALPTVPTVSGGGTICSGQSTTLTASGCNGAILWSTTATTTSISVSSAGTYTASCVNSCGTSAASSEIVVNVTTTNPPTLAGATTICGGQNVTLTASGCAGTVVWSNASSGTSISVNPSTTTSFTATCTANSCTSIASESVTVTVSPSIDFTVESITDLCNSSTSFSLPYSVTLGSPDKYSLTSTMSGFTAITDATLVTSPIVVNIPSGKTGTFSFTLTLKISETGCSKSQTFNVTILPILAGGSIEVSPSSINCAGYTPASISSESLASGGKSAYTYQWQSSTDSNNFTDISGANQSGFTPTASITQTTYYRRKVTDACGAEAFSSNNHQVTIVPDPQITLTDASDKVVCSGVSFTLDATVLGGSGTCTPTWQSSNSASTGFVTEQSGGLSFSKSLTNTSATPLVKYFKVIYACAGTGSGSCNQSTSEVVKVTVNYIPLPPTVTPASVVICPTQSTTLTASGCAGVVTWTGGQTGSTLSVSTSGSYTAICSINNCTSEQSSSSIVTLASSSSLVSPPTITGTATICNGQSTPLTATGCTGLVTWSDGKTGTSISVNPSLSTNYTATCNDGTCTSNASNVISVIVNNYPSITTQPKNDADCNGNSVSFTVVASPAMSYQWQRKVPNGTFVNITDATAKSLTISDVGSVTAPHLSQYQVIVSNEGCAVTSNPATLTVNSVTGSIADQTVCGGTNVSFNLSAITITGAIETYQWQSRIGTSGTWNDIVGANTTTLAIMNAIDTDEQYYRCKINFTAGSSTCARYSTEDDANGAKLTVLVETTPIISGAKAICLGKSTTLTANSCNGNISWSSGQTTASITVLPTVATSYTVTCSSPQCAFSVTSASHTVAVNATPVPESITYDVITPTTLTFRVKSSVPNATIMWYTRATGGTGTTTAPPTFTKVGTYGYWATQIDPITGCESPRVPVFAKILDYFHINSQPNTQADCKGNSVNLSVTAVGPVNYFVYQWQRKRPNEPDFVNLAQDGNGIKGWNQQRLTVSNVGSDDNPHLSQYRCVINNEGHFLTSNPATISVNSVIGALPNFGTCVGRNFAINLVNYFTITGNVLSYQWQTRPGTSGDWTDLKDAGNLIGSTTNELKLNNIDYDKAAYYRCLVKFDTQGFICTEPTDATRLIVGGYPSPPEVSDIAYCQFAKPAKLKADKSVFDLIWYNQKSDIVGSSIAPTPNTDIVGTTSYFVAEQTDQGCESPRVEIKVNVEALPPAPINTTPSEVDEGQPLTFSADGTPKEGQILRWYTSPTGTTFTTIAPVFSAVGTYTRYVAQVSAAGCIGPRTAITARIIPNMKFTRQPTSQADCDGNSVTFSLTASAPTAFTYQWQRQRPAETLFTDIANEVSNSLKISDVGDAENPHLTKYRCVIKDEKGSLISDEVSLTVNEIKGTLANITLCDGETTKLSFNSLTITGNVLSYQWQKKEGSTYTDIPTNQQGIANVSEIGTYRGRVTFAIDNKTTCVRTTDDLKVDVKPVPVGPKVANQAICQNTSFNLEKTITAANTLLWYESAEDTTADKTTPKIDLSKVGKTTFYVSQITQFGCESERKSFDLVISPIPAKPVVNDISYCRNAPSIALVASTETENKLLWYASQTAKDAFVQTPIPDTKTDGTTTYYVSAKNAANCESSRVAMKVSVALCIATFENNFNNCVQISADSVKGNKWYDLYDAGGRLYASVNPNGLDLGKVSVSVRHYGRGSTAIPATKNDTKFMARYTDFQSSLLQNFEKPVSLRIYYENAELNEYKTASNLPNLTINDFNIVHYDGVREDCGFENNDNFVEGNSVVIYKNVAGSQVTKDFFYLQFDVNEFSENGATANRFTDVTFAANETPDKAIKLNWQTKFEIKAEKFILQRSADCTKWVSLGEIKANVANGSYEQLDNQPLSGKSCYRLIYIDKDGTKKYLDPIEVTLTDSTPVCSVFPNPWTTGDVVKLYLRNIKEKEIKLYDLVGQQYSFDWKKDELGIIHLRPDSPLVKGTHFVVVVGEDGKRCIQKIVINP